MRQASAIVGGLAYLLSTVAWVFVLALVAYFIFASLPAAPAVQGPVEVTPPAGGGGESAGPGIMLQIFAVALGIVALFSALAFTAVLPILLARWCSRWVHRLTVALFGKKYRLRHLVAVKAGITVIPVVMLIIVLFIAPNAVTVSLAIAGIFVASLTLLFVSVQLIFAKAARLSIKEIF